MRSLIAFGILCAAAGAAAAAGAPATPSAESATKTAAANVAVRYDRLTDQLAVSADRADLEGLLIAVGVRTGVPIHLGAGVSGTATVAFSGLPLAEGVRRIAESAGVGNLAVEYAQLTSGTGTAACRVVKVSLFGGAAATQPLAQGHTGSVAEAPVAHQVAPAVTVAPALPRVPAVPAPSRGEKTPPPPVPPAGRPPARGFDSGRDGAWTEAMMRAARQGDVRAIDQLGRIGVQRATPVLEGILAASPEGSPPWAAAAKALHKIASARQAHPAQGATP